MGSILKVSISYLKVSFITCSAIEASFSSIPKHIECSDEA